MHPINIVFLNCAGLNETDVKEWVGFRRKVGKMKKSKGKIVSTFQKTPK